MRNPVSLGSTVRSLTVAAQLSVVFHQLWWPAEPLGYSGASRLGLRARELSAAAPLFPYESEQQQILIFVADPERLPQHSFLLVA